MAPTILVVAPMPAYPASAGNRRRLLTTCESLRRGGFAVDLAYVAHEDQIYRRFGQHPPTDHEAMASAFQRVFVIEPRDPIRLKTKAKTFGIDEWCPDEAVSFVEWYGPRHPETVAILVNYVFLSRCLERAPAGMPTLIDTHDRFADRREQYRPFRAEPNFFHTDRAGEAIGLGRADIALAIQSEEAAYFETLTDRAVHRLPPRFLARRPFQAPAALRRIGFIGHGNDPNLFSIGKFAHEWAEGWEPGRPELVIAGEICGSLGALALPGVRLLGYVAALEEFYDGVDLVVAPMLMGSGLKMKVAEALSFGLPAIGTGLGFEGFESLIPAHRCRGVAAVKAEVLSLAADPAKLAALTQACADLFAGYNTRTEAAESALVAMIRARAGVAPAEPREARLPPRHISGLPEICVAGAQVGQARLGCGEGSRVGVAGRPSKAASGATPTSNSSPQGGGEPAASSTAMLACETSLRSLPVEGDGAILIATERGPPGDEPYAPERRRWLARDGGALNGDLGLAGARIALSPEWVRRRRLSKATREALAPVIAAARPDWAAQGRLIGAGAGRIVIALPAPGFLTTGRREAAAFLIGGDDAAMELSVESAAPLQAGPGLAFAGPGRGDLAPVPMAMTLRGDGIAAPRSLLLLHDDLIGLVTLVEDFAPGAPA